MKAKDLKFLERLEAVGGKGGSLDVWNSVNGTGGVAVANTIALSLREKGLVITGFAEEGEQGIHVEFKDAGRAALHEAREERARAISRHAEVEAARARRDEELKKPPTPIATIANADVGHKLKADQRVDAEVVPGPMPQGAEAALLQWLDENNGEGGAYDPFNHPGGGDVSKSNCVAEALVRNGWIVYATPPEAARHHGKYVKITANGRGALQRHLNRISELLKARNAQKEIDELHALRQRAQSAVRAESEAANLEIAARQEGVRLALEALAKLDPAKAAEARRLLAEDARALAEREPAHGQYTPEEIQQSQRVAQQRVDELRALNEAAARRDGAAVLKGQDRIDARKGTSAKGEEPVYNVRIVDEKRGLGWKAWTAIAALGMFIFLTAVAFVVEAVKPEAIDAIRARLPWVQKESPASPALPTNRQSGSPGSSNDPDVPTLPHDPKEAPDVKTLPAPSGAVAAPTTHP
jgi:DNA-binding PadR family transcriptional regulator